MANLVLTKFESKQKSIGDALSALETELETVDTAKTRVYVDIIREGTTFTAVALYAT